MSENDHAYPPQDPHTSNPSQDHPGHSLQNPDLTTHSGGYPVNDPGYPPQDPEYPQKGYPLQDPANAGYPPEYPGPAQQGYQPPPPGYPPTQQHAYPQQQGYPPQGYPQQSQAPPEGPPPPYPGDSGVNINVQDAGVNINVNNQPTVVTEVVMVRTDQVAMPTYPPATHLGFAICVTLCCCCPFGVYAIMQSSQVNERWAAGDTRGAMMASNSAKQWSWNGVIFAVLTVTLSLVIRFAIL